MEAIVGILVLTFSIVSFAGLMKIWENTGRTARATELQWQALAQLHGYDPKTGQRLSGAGPLNG